MALLATGRIEIRPDESVALSDVAAAAAVATRAAFQDVALADQHVVVGADAKLAYRILGLWQAGAVPVVVPGPLSCGRVPGAQWDWREQVPIRRAEDGSPTHGRGDDRLAIVHLSSGSTGLPRPSPRSMASLVAEAQRYVARYRLARGERVLLAAPIGHSFGFGAFLGAAAAGGIVSLPATFNAGRLARRLRNGAFDVAVLTVPMARLLVMAAGPEHAAGAPGPRLAIAGAGPVSEQLAAAFEHNFGCPLGRNYGSSETGATFGAATALPEGVIGRPFDGVRIIAPAVPGEAAELILDLGHAILANASDAEISPIRRTGDRATLLPDGTIRLHGRLDDRLKIDGMSLDAGAIAAAVRSVPGVRDAVALAAAAHGTPDRDLLVVACEGVGVHRERIRATVAVTGAPSPLVLTFASLPRTAAGKLDRAAILAAMARRPPMAETCLATAADETAP